MGLKFQLQQTVNASLLWALVCWEPSSSIQSHQSSNFLPMWLPTVHVTVGSVPAVPLWHQSGAPRPFHNLQSLCQDQTSCYSFLLLVFNRMLFVLDNCTLRINRTHLLKDEEMGDNKYKCCFYQPLPVVSDDLSFERKVGCRGLSWDVSPFCKAVCWAVACVCGSVCELNNSNMA